MPPVQAASTGTSATALPQVVRTPAERAELFRLGGPTLQQVKDNGATVSMATPKPSRNGPAVAYVQDLLDAEVDGKFGPLTEEAVKDFQQEHGLVASGVIDRALLAKLDQVFPGGVKAPATVKPAEPKPTQAPGGTKPVDTKPTESKPPVKPADPKPTPGGIDIDVLQRTCGCGAPHGTTPVPTTKHIRTEGKSIFMSSPKAHRDGGAVAWVQERLGLKPDGRFGATTDGAIRAFQQKHQLPVNGAINKQLLEALDTHGKKIALGAPTKDRIPTGRFPKPVMKVKPSPNFEPRDGEKIDSIILHDTGNPVKDVAKAENADLRWLTTPGSNASSHYIVQRDGTITQLVSDEQMAYHAGQSYLQGKDSVGKRSLGIEICNQGNGAEPFTEKQMQAVIKLVGYLREKHQVQMSNITSHAAVAMPAGRKSDPGPNFDWKRLRSSVA